MQAIPFSARLAITLLVLSLSTLLQAATEQGLSPAELIGQLQKGGNIVYLRHAATDHDSRDSGTADLNDCSKQRNLSQTGRQQATQIGVAIKQLGIPLGSVLSSPYCRCRDTAQLAFGRYTSTPDLQFSISKDREESRQLGARLREMMLAADTQSGNAVFVGHTSNLRDGLGVWPKPEGVMLVFRRDGDRIGLLGRIAPDQWPGAAAD